MKMNESSRAVDKKLLDNNKMLGKSYLTAVFCCVRAILYPSSKIILASGNKKQAGNIITEKIVDLQRQSPALDREIKEIKTQHDNICCIFKNGSVIRVATSGDGSRGRNA